MPRRTTSFIAAGAVLAGVLALGLPSAAGATPPTVRVGAALAQSTTDAGLVTVRYTIAVTGAITGAVLDTPVFDTVPDPASVQLDGTTVPSGTISTFAATMSVRLGSGADAVNGGTLTDETHVLSFQQRRPSAPGPYATISGTLRFLAIGTPSSVTSAQLPLTHPDLVVTAPGESNVLPLGTGRPAGFGALIANRGTTSPATTIHIALPPGLRLDPANGVLRLDAATGQATRIPCGDFTTAHPACAFGAVAHGAQEIAIVVVKPLASARAGSVATFHVSAFPRDEPDQNAADNSVAGRVRYSGTAVLHVALKAASSTVRVGKTTTISLQITNDGPQAAVATVSIVVVEPKHFAITAYSTKRNVPGPDMFRLTSPAKYGGAIEWNAGTIAAHRTVYAELVVKAVDPGVARIAFIGTSDSGDPRCDSGSPACGELTMISLKAVR